MGESCLKNHWPALALILFLLAFHGVVNSVVLSEDTVLFDRKPAEQYMDAVNLSTWTLGDVFLHPVKVLTWVSPLTQWGIVSPGLVALFMSVFGVSQDIAVMSNIVWLGVLLASLYAITLKLSNKRAALLSVGFVSFFPGMIAATRGIAKDFPLAAAISLSLCFLLYSDGLQRRGIAILFALATVLAALTHTSFFLYFLSPVLALVCVPLIQKIRHQGLHGVKNLLVTIGIVTLLVVLLAFPWYMKMGNEYARSSWGDGTDYLPHEQPPFLLFGLGELLTPVFLVLTVCSLVFLWETPAGIIPLRWALPPMAFYIALGLTVPYFGPSNLRHLIPVIPAFAVALGAGLDKLLSSLSEKSAAKAFRMAFAFFVVGGVLFTLHITFVQDRDLQGAFDGGMYTPRHLNLNYRLSPVKMDADVISAIDALELELELELTDRETPPIIFVTNHLGPLTQMVLTELEVRQTLSGNEMFTISMCILGDKRPLDWISADECATQLASADYVLIEDMNAIPQVMVEHESFTLMREHIASAQYRTVAALSTLDIDTTYYDTFQIMPAHGYTVPEESFIALDTSGGVGFLILGPSEEL